MIVNQPQTHQTILRHVREGDILGFVDKCDGVLCFDVRFVEARKRSSGVGRLKL